MSRALDDLAHRKEVLRARCTLQRLELLNAVQAAGDSLPFLRRDPESGTTVSIGRWLVGLALRRLVVGAVGKGLALTSGTVLLIKVVRLVLSLLRKPVPMDIPIPSAGEG